MEDYKGLYHNEQQDIKSFEHGAHFKYLDLVDALNKLLKKHKKHKELENKDNEETKEIKEKKEKKKNTKKYKLKSYKKINDNDNGNQRYNDIINKEEEYQKNEGEKYDHIYNRNSLHISQKKILNSISRSVDRANINLPKINFNNNSINGNKSNLYCLRNQSYNPKDLKKLLMASECNNIQIIRDNDCNENENKEDFLPKLNLPYYKLNKEEKEYRKNNGEINSFSFKKRKNKRNNNFFLNEINDKSEIINSENEKKGIIRDKLRSIFEIEKLIKRNSIKNNLINNYSRNNIDLISNDISSQIFHLKKSSLVNTNKREIV